MCSGVAAVMCHGSGTFYSVVNQGSVYELLQGIVSLSLPAVLPSFFICLSSPAAKRLLFNLAKSPAIMDFGVHMCTFQHWHLMFSLHNFRLCADFLKFNRVFKIASWGRIMTLVAYLRYFPVRVRNYLMSGNP